MGLAQSDVTSNWTFRTDSDGIGLLKRGGMQRELQTEVLAIELDLKNMFDPMDLFNPGKVTGTPAVL